MKKKERKRILDNFYIKQMKNGRAKRAYLFDKTVLWIFLFLIIFFTLNIFINYILISFTFGIGVTLYLAVIFNKKLEKIKDKKIEKIKDEYHKKLIEEDILKDHEDIDDYVIEKHLKRKKTFKEDVDIYAKGKALKLYILSLMFFIGSYFVDYSIYYKTMGILAFVIANFILSKKLIEYINKKDDNSLLDGDIDV